MNATQSAHITVWRRCDWDEHRQLRPGKLRRVVTRLSGAFLLSPVEHVVACDGKIPQSKLDSIWRYRRLKYLTLTACELPPGAFNGMRRDNRLEEIYLFESNVRDDDVLAILQASPNLQVINLSSTPITEKLIRHLAEQKALRKVFLDDTEIPEESIRWLIEQRPDLDVVWWNDSQKSTVASLHIHSPVFEADNDGFITEVRLFSGDVDDETMRIAGSFDRLRHLEIVCGKEVTDEGMRSLAKLRALEILKLPMTRISNEGSKYLLGFAQLAVLDLSGSQISDDAASTLAPLRSLTELNLSCSRARNRKVWERALPGCRIIL